MGVHMRFLISVFVDLGCTKQTRNRVQVGGGNTSNMVCRKGALWKRMLLMACTCVSGFRCLSTRAAQNKLIPTMCRVPMQISIGQIVSQFKSYMQARLCKAAAFQARRCLNIGQVDDQQCALKRVQGLLPGASADALLEVEKLLRAKQSVRKNNHNPEGVRVAATSGRICKGKRPPSEDAEPWHTRVAASGATLATSLGPVLPNCVRIVFGLKLLTRTLCSTRCALVVWFQEVRSDMFFQARAHCVLYFKMPTWTMKNGILPQREQEILHHMNVRVICNIAACPLRFGFDGLAFRGRVDSSLTACAHGVSQ